MQEDSHAGAQLDVQEDSHAGAQLEEQEDSQDEPHEDTVSQLLLHLTTGAQLLVQQERTTRPQDEPQERYTTLDLPQDDPQLFELTTTAPLL